MRKNETLLFMAKIRAGFIDYFTEQIEIENTSLNMYDKIGPIDRNESTDEVKKLREIQSILIRDRITQLNKHIAVKKEYSRKMHDRGR